MESERTGAIKICPPIPRRSANHLSLIRSFLIDSSPFAPSREANCAKFFCCANTHDPIALTRAGDTNTGNFCARLRFAQLSLARKKSLFHRNFCNLEIMSAARSVNLKKILTRDERAFRMRDGTPNACRVHVSLSGTLFFLLCCSK